MKNYLPIFLWSYIFKNYRNIVLIRLMAHLKHQNLLKNSKHKSTSSAITSIIEYIITQFDNKT